MSSKTKTTASAEEAKTALVPKLRFPEFRDLEGWQRRQLVDVCSKITQGGTPDTSKPEYWGGTINWMTPAEMGKTESPFIGSTNRTITELGLGDCSSDLLPLNTVILSVRAPIGHLAINTVPMAINQGCKGLIPGKLLDFYFLFSSLLEAKTRLIDLGAGNTFKELSGSALKSFQIPVPSPAEQQKIAECLSSVDELMAAQARKVDALKTHKKGLMQQLFPREGETQPRLRFPEFQNAGEWEETNLGNFFDPIRNGFVGTATPYYTTSDGVRYLQGRNIKQGRIEADNLIYITNEFHSRQRKSHLKDGDILMVQSGHVGECAVVGSEFVGCNCHALVILTPKRKLSSAFFVHYFYSPIGELAIFQITTGNTIKHILASELKTLPVLVPDLAEQQRIATCLGSLDALITAETQKLDALKTHKKGLMQQLFPSENSELRGENGDVGNEK